MTDPIASLLGEWSSELNIYSIILRLILAMIFGAIIGWERANKRHAAGLRTFILATLAATSAMIVELLLSSAIHVMGAAVLIAVAIISSNITIFSSKSQIKGITTSVGLWVSAIVGLVLGAGYYTVALISFLCLILSLSLFPRFETYLKNRSNHFEIHLELKNSSYLKDFSKTIRELGLRVDDIEVNPAYIGSGLSVYSISLSIVSAELKKYKTHSEIIEALKSLEYVSYIEEMN